ncbi:hypothetical protein [Paenibacillus puerhi]|uniref:hypothetical protein n=1 Tax=Paenibacillus puerhi TaxID=2692622 RepID=UPI00135806E6|nr:hypothetical protein [Paenibacillus puerhi]
MDGMTVFTNFRPIYILFILILATSLIVMVSLKNYEKLMNGSTIVGFSLVSSAVSAYLTYQIGILSDELAIGGDPVSFLMFMAIVFLSAANLLVYLIKNMRN